MILCRKTIVFIVILFGLLISNTIKVSIDRFLFVDRNITGTIRLDTDMIVNKVGDYSFIKIAPIGDKCFKEKIIRLSSNVAIKRFSLSSMSTGNTQVGVFVNDQLMGLSSTIKVINTKKKSKPRRHKGIASRLIEFHSEDYSDTQELLKLLFNMDPKYIVYTQMVGQYDRVKILFPGTRNELNKKKYKGNNFYKGIFIEDIGRYLILNIDIKLGVSYRMQEGRDRLYIMLERKK